jgi:hypothetical protein
MDRIELSAFIVAMAKELEMPSPTLKHVKNSMNAIDVD